MHARTHAPPLQGLMHELQHNLYLGHATGLNAAGQLDE